MRYTIRIIETRGRSTVARFLRIEANGPADASWRVERLHPNANIVRVEGPHD